ncbi:MAG: right-handed parallel beta-helix repeat-containing protein [Planctomycetes bacterium]|nr:right-handed parallel beta-helix repeat-containing protein [Planctomycetota bacterium]
MKQSSQTGGHAAMIWTCLERLEERILLTTYYVNPTGAGGEFSSIQSALDIVAPGDTVIVRDGTYNVSSELDTRTAGTVSNRITLKAENPRGAIVTRSGRLFRIDQPNYTIEGLVFDGQWADRDIIQPHSSADNLILRNIEVCYGRNDGIDLASPENVLIEDCLVHDMLGWSDGRYDAHGIVTDGAKNLTIRNTEVYYVSGDAFQAIYGTWNNILIDGCTFWNGDLPTARAGFPAGVNPGENAVDTKKDPSYERGRIDIRDSVFYGWASDYIGTASALNMKTKIETVMERNVLYGNEYAMRLRGRDDDAGAHCTVINNIFYDNICPIRYEDGIKDLKVYNNTFDEGDGTFFDSPDYAPYMNGEFMNNLFLIDGSLPPEAIDPSNLGVDESSFVDAAARDYHLAAGSPAIDVAVMFAEVSDDFDQYSRPQGAGYDVGAYEYRPGAQVTITAVDADADEAGSDPGEFIITRGDSDGDLTVYYTVGGSAGADDYAETLTGSAVIASGYASTTITITPIDDIHCEGEQTVVLGLVADTAYTVTPPGEATVTIADNDSYHSLGQVNLSGSWTTGLTHPAQWGYERLLIFTAHIEDREQDPAVISVSYGGRAMTRIDSLMLNPNGYRSYVTVFYLDEADIAAASGDTFSVSLSTGSTAVTGYSSGFLTGVDQSRPIGATAHSSGAYVPVVSTAPLATADGDLVTMTATNTFEGDFTANNSFTEGAELDIVGVDGVAAYKPATGATETPSVSHDDPRGMVLIGFVVQASKAYVPLPGDTDLDEDVDAADLATLGINWAPSGIGKTHYDGDFDHDGDVDASDLAVLGLSWNPSGSAVALPTPSSDDESATVDLLRSVDNEPDNVVEQSPREPAVTAIETISDVPFAALPSVVNVAVPINRAGAAASSGAEKLEAGALDANLVGPLADVLDQPW